MREPVADQHHLYCDGYVATYGEEMVWYSVVRFGSRTILHSSGLTLNYNGRVFLDLQKSGAFALERLWREVGFHSEHRVDQRFLFLFRKGKIGFGADDQPAVVNAPDLVSLFPSNLFGFVKVKLARLNGLHAITLSRDLAS